MTYWHLSQKRKKKKKNEPIENLVLKKYMYIMIFFFLISKKYIMIDDIYKYNIYRLNKKSWKFIEKGSLLYGLSSFSVVPLLMAFHRLAKQKHKIQMSTLFIDEWRWHHVSQNSFLDMFCNGFYLLFYHLLESSLRRLVFCLPQV